MQEYINDSSSSYRKLAKKYGVSYSFIARLAKKEDWVNKRKMNTEKEMSRKSADKLSLLKKTSDKSIEALYAKINDDLSINDLKNISSIIKTMTGVQRDLYGLPTFKEENSIRISNERLKLVRARVASGADDESESGVVFIPLLDEEENDDDVVYEREENV